MKPIEPKYLSTIQFIENSHFDYEKNSYFCSLAAAYVTAFKCGISEKHLTNSFPNAKSNIVTSIVRYHLYFHMTRFMRNPKLFDRYITEDDIWTIRKFAPVKETWKRRYESSHANIRKSAVASGTRSTSDDNTDELTSNSNTSLAYPHTTLKTTTKFSLQKCLTD